MPNYTTNLNLEKPLQSEQYDIDVFNANADKIDQFAGQTPARALTADKLTTGAKINGVNFKGDTDVVTGAGFYYETVTYGAGDLAFIYNQDDALELHKSLSAGNIGHNPLTSTGYWEKVELGGSGGRNVGEIITSSLPLTDAGLHLLDGSRLSGDGIYKDFVDYIADLYTENPSANYFCTETQWQASITQYGVCGKFVYDSELNTVRLPKVTGIIEGTTDLSALGNLVEAGLPNITGAFNGYKLTDTGNVGTGAFTGTSDIVRDTPANVGGDQTQNGFSFDASLSNSIYGNSTTVQPQTIKCFVYIVIATSTKTDIQVDIDEIATDLNGKADVDLSNISASQNAKDEIISWGLPDWDNKISLSTNNVVNTIPSLGYVHLNTRTSTPGGLWEMTINNNVVATWFNSSSYGYSGHAFIPVKQGDTTAITAANLGDGATYEFIPMKGAN